MVQLKEKKQREKNESMLLIFLVWLMYATSYFGKVNYSANITQIIDFYGVTKAEAGMAPTFFFFAYGIGQVVNGILCKKYNMKWAIFGSIVISASINLVVAVGTNFAIIKWLWLVNGFVLSMLWPTLMRLITESLPQKDLAKASVIIGTTVASGTLIIYALSAVYVAFDMFKLSFYTAFLANFIVAIIWALTYKKAVRKAKSEQKAEVQKAAETVVQETVQQKKGEKKIFYAIVCALCVCAVGCNLIKDGLTTWVPAILKEEYGMADSISILLTIFLPIVAIFGNVWALKVHEKISDYVTHCAVIFLATLGFICLIIGSLTFKQAAVILVGLIAASFLANSINSLLTSIFPMFMRGKVNSGLIAGVLNGFCYVGSAFSSYGLGGIADKYGWIAVFWTLAGFCAVICLIWCLYTAFKRRVEKKEQI